MIITWRKKKHLSKSHVATNNWLESFSQCCLTWSTQLIKLNDTYIYQYFFSKLLPMKHFISPLDQFKKTKGPDQSTETPIFFTRNPSSIHLPPLTSLRISPSTSFLSPLIFLLSLFYLLHHATASSAPLAPLRRRDIAAKYWLALKRNGTLPPPHRRDTTSRCWRNSCQLWCQRVLGCDPRALKMLLGFLPQALRLVAAVHPPRLARVRLSRWWHCYDLAVDKRWDEILGDHFHYLQRLSLSLRSSSWFQNVFLSLSPLFFMIPECVNLIFLSIQL